jgi:pimeloyl-ACP methyl ester carboxylesterase
MARLVLVHGAFVGGWIWERLVEPLEAAGHTVEILDLPGSGDDQTPVEEVTLDAYAERVCAQLRQRPEPAVLVANSMGGLVSTQAAARRPEQVEAIVYVAAFVPQDGQSLMALTQLPEGAEDEIQANLVVEGDPPVGRMPDDASHGAQYADCSDEDAAWAIERQRPNPVAPFEAPVSIPDGAFDGIPRSYVLCTRDRSIPPALQRRMVAENGITEVIELETDHTPQLSSTAELAEAVNRLVSRTREEGEVVR